MDWIKQGQAALGVQLDEKRADLYMSYKEFIGMNGKDSYVGAVESIVNQIGDDGVTAADLNDVFPDSKLLTKAREELEVDGKIEVTKEKTTWRLRPSGAAARITAAKK